MGYIFRPITWQNDVVPLFGAHPQDIIDDSVGDNYDGFLGIMSTKFGTPTKEWASGTEHEFRRAYARKIALRQSLELMFYFQNPGFSGREIDVQELNQVVSFKESISDKGMYSQYKTIEDFTTKVTSHLSQLMDLIIKNKALLSVETVEITTQTSETDALANPLSIFEALSNEEEPGFIELTEDATDSFGSAISQLSALTDALSTLSNETNSQTATLTKLGDKKSINDTKAILKKSSRTMDNFVETSTVILPLLHSHLAVGLQLSRELIIIAPQESAVTERDKLSFYESLAAMKNGMDQGRISFVTLSDQITALPRATTEFNRSKRRLKAVIDGLCKFLDSAVVEVSDIQHELAID